MRKILHEPLFYLLPLLVIVGFWIIPTKLDISDVVLITGGKSYPESFPISTHKVIEHSDFSILFNINVKNNKHSVYKFYPDDCIFGIKINGKTFPQEMIKEPCSYNNGTIIDLSEYTQKGLNRIEFQISNDGGPGGLRVEIPSSVGLRHFLFIVLLLITSALIFRKLKLSRESFFACVLSFPFVIYAFVELCVRIKYELSEVWNADTTIYYAVGRGIVNGIAPWSGLFEIKPPGIFLVSAISFKFFDSSVFVNYFQAFVLILTAAIPIVAYFLLSAYRSTSKLAFSLLAGLLLALYSAECAGEVQTESFGAAFACIAVLAMAVLNFEKRKKLWISLATVGILGACGFKEPFLFPLFGVSLILCKDIKEWAWRFALPLAIAVLLGFVILLICGWLDGFLHYLEFMSSTHISRYGSPFHRAMEFHRLYESMNNFSWGFAIAVLALLSLPFINSKPNENVLFIKIAPFGIAFFLSSYTVGLGGEFFQQHFVFALPFYMALFLFLLKNWNGENFAVVKLGFISFIFLAIAALNLPVRDYVLQSKNINDTTKEIEQAATYLDSKMDELDIDRYAFIGYHDAGTQIFGWTRHSPMGPYFNQQGNWFELGAGDSLISNLKKADVAVLGTMGLEFEPIANHIYDILNEQFTKEQVNRFPIYFRKNKVF
ncbi:MAG: hypothetical protein LBC64_03690 [Fibromonadaceae bacterium]|jgi:hypothetical protein|nr:hypothetical protein [Fibromonadaceae bacterium]